MHGQGRSLQAARLAVAALPRVACPSLLRRGTGQPGGTAYARTPLAVVQQPQTVGVCHRTSACSHALLAPLPLVSLLRDKLILLRPHRHFLSASNAASTGSASQQHLAACASV